MRMATSKVCMVVRLLVAPSFTPMTDNCVVTVRLSQGRLDAGTKRLCGERAKDIVWGETEGLEMCVREELKEAEQRRGCKAIVHSCLVTAGDGTEHKLYKHCACEARSSFSPFRQVTTSAHSFSHSHTQNAIIASLDDITEELAIMASHIIEEPGIMASSPDGFTEGTRFSAGSEGHDARVTPGTGHEYTQQGETVRRSGAWHLIPRLLLRKEDCDLAFLDTGAMIEAGGDTTEVYGYIYIHQRRVEPRNRNRWIGSPCC
jgi:hypothetical protein